MTKGGDVTSIAATTAGVSGTITVPAGCRLTGLNLSWVLTNDDEIPQIVELTWTGSPSPLRFVPNAFSILAGTPAAGGGVFPNADIAIPLDVVVQGATVVTVKITSSGNVTVKVGLEWEIEGGGGGGDLQGDYASISATTAGVAGTISVPAGATLIGLNASMKGDGGLISSIEIKGPGIQQPLKFVPNLCICLATNGAAHGMAKSPLIDLGQISINNPTNVSIVVTTTANETVVVGLVWRS
jgi:hypothetical protein